MTDRTLKSAGDLDALTYNDQGLLPVVAQDATDGRVLMVAWANREALERTLDSGRATFWSRSRGEIWEKGATSGNSLELVSLHADCDGDTVLARVNPAGPACHTGEATCFGVGADPALAWSPGDEGVVQRADAAIPSPATESTLPATESTLPAVWATLLSRAAERPEGSYTVKLLDDENLRIKKLGEETAELIHALLKKDGRAAEETADLLYHALVALLASGQSLDDLLAELERRR